MAGRWAIFVGFALLVLLAAFCLVAIFRIDIAPVVEKKKGPVRTREFAEGIRLSQKGLIGIDLVSIGRARMRKLRKGPFTIGAINELVLEDVAVALPEELWNVDAKSVRVPVDAKSVRVPVDAKSVRVPVDAESLPRQKEDGSVLVGRDQKIASTGRGKDSASTERGTAARRMLGALGINPGHIKMGEKIPRFSALAIRNIKVSRIVGGTNAVPWFVASSAKAERDGLALSSGYSIENGVTNTWKEALLAVDPKLILYHK